MDGIVVMLQHMSNNSEAIQLYKDAQNKQIKKVVLNRDADPHELILYFTDGTAIAFLDTGQSCCESRYMVCDDSLSEFVGATFLSAELAEAQPSDYPDAADDYGDAHEIVFLRIHTDKGDIVVSNHNEHNGYYGGFAITIAERSGEK